MSLRLYNTLSSTKENVPADPSVGMYVCGVTPYDTTHVGHARTYLVFDVLLRHLLSDGRRVDYVQNVTDVDDSILKRADELGVTYRDLGERFTSQYIEDCASLGMLPATHYPKATDAIPEMQEVIRRLLDGGYAYEVEGDVYFNVAAWPDFGNLSRLPRDEMLRIEAEQDAPTIDDTRKKDALDFALWRAARPGEPAWDSPWGRGRPGWHIECSTLALRHLGPQIDIHGGGDDLIYPHHECEIPQAEAATGISPFVRLWMHVAMVRLGGKKMSKSLGNMVFVRDLLPTYSPDAIRLYLLSVHYREPLDFDEGELRRAAATAQDLARAGSLHAARAKRDPIEAEAARVRFGEALDDDLDTPRAIATVTGLAERLLKQPDDADYETRRTVRDLAARLGLSLQTSPGGRKRK